HSLAAAKTLRLGEAQIDAGATTVTWAAKARTSRSAIDTRSRAAVAKAYRQRLRPALRSAPVRKPSGCRAPATPKAEQKRAVKAINFDRAMAGLDPVKLKASLSRRATQAALIQYHAGFLSHFPPASAKCWTKTGAAASANSNLLLRGSSIPLKSWPEGAGGSARGYMIDSGPHNESVGHRWWLLEPQLAAVGIGNVGLANATYVGAKLKATRATPPWIAWPSAGYFPKQEEPEGRWSFQSPRPDTSFAKAKVKVTTASGRRLPVRKLDATPAGPIAGWHAIVWKVGRLPKVAGRKARLVTVTVSGIVQRGERLAPQRYQVKLFDPSK
ncbi:MAG: hypothetical protein LBT54_08140, partial [Bifidobacteriaceae bacterium]|nr:hypothetical protein [Bifidobacteriaceae bacterium]